MMFVVILMSSNSLIMLFTNINETIVALCPLVALIAGALDIVLSFSGQARTHTILARRWAHLIEQTKEDQPDVSKIKAEESAICRDEPSIYIALDGVAHNSCCRGYGYKNGLIDLKWYHNLFKNFIPFSNFRP